MAEVGAKQVGADVALPGAGQASDKDLRGYVPKIKIERAPFVKEKLSGMIWPWQDWMQDMGDVLEPCWTAPPKPALVVPTGPLDLSHYGQQARQQVSEAAHQPEAKSPSVQPAKAKAKAGQKRRSSRARGTPRTPAVAPQDGNAQ